jgi:hypothetical protein
VSGTCLISTAMFIAGICLSVMFLNEAR